MTAGARVQPGPDCHAFATNDPEKSTASKGTAVHRAIREQLEQRFNRLGYGPSVRVSFADAAFAPYSDRLSLTIGGKRQGVGYIDLAFRSQSKRKPPAKAVMVLAEIKPANWPALIDGETQLGNYLEKANNDDDVKAKYGVSEFQPMLPSSFPLPRYIYCLGEAFQIRWCGSGLILYKQVRRKKEESEREKRTGEQTRPASGAVAASESRATDRPIKVEILRSSRLPAWTPDQLRRDIQAGTLTDGLYRNRYMGAWPQAAQPTNVVVWVKTSALGREVQFYQEYPSDPAFYQQFGKRRGLSVSQADLIRRVMTEYNRDLWSLIAPDPLTGIASSRSPYYARDELRYIYDQILKDTLSGSATIIGTGAAVGALGAAARSAGVRGTGTPGTRPAASAQEAPLPAWVTEAVEKGFEAFTKQLGAPVP
jgi:hypothetical protein